MANHINFTSQEDQPQLINADTLLLVLPESARALFSVIDIGNPVGGSVQRLEDGRILFTPEANFHGEATFQYIISDGSRNFLLQAGFAIAEVNDAPESPDLNFQSLEDQIVNFAIPNLLSFASDVDGDTLDITAIADVVGGSAQITDDGMIQFIPDPNYHGNAYFEYVIEDGRGGSTTARLDIALTEVNDNPFVTHNHIADTQEDTRLNIGQDLLLQYAQDVDGDTLSVSNVTQAVGGSAVLGADGMIQFTPEANFHGQAYFDYTVSDGRGGEVSSRFLINYAEVNDVPVVLDAQAVGNEDQRLVFEKSTLLQHAVDADGDILTVAAAGASHGGNAQLNSDGSILFTPDPHFYGQAYFDYSVSDGRGGIATARITIDINEVNDIPVSTDLTLSADEDTALNFSQAVMLSGARDADGDALRVVSVGQALNGSVTLDASGNAQFVPTANFNGRAGFTAQISDGRGGVTDTFIGIDYRPVNDAPLIGDRTVNDPLLEDFLISFRESTLLEGAIDVDGDALSVSRILSASHGTVSEENGVYIFSPDANYHGPASFTYEISDGKGGTATATAHFNLHAVNDAPIIVQGTLNTREDTQTFLDADLIARDIDGDRLFFSEVHGADHGTLNLYSGVLAYTPHSNYHGADTIRFTVSDGTTTITSSFNVHVQSVNDAPVIDSIDTRTGDVYRLHNKPEFSMQAPTVHTSQMELINGEYRYDPRETDARPVFEALPWDHTLIGVDTVHAGYFSREQLSSKGLHEDGSTGRIYASDAEGDAFTYSIVSHPSHGSVSIDPNTGAWTYIMGNNDPYVGEVSFDVAVTDVHGASSTARIVADHYGEEAGTGGGGSLPVVLDLDRDGVEFAQLDDSNVLTDLRNGEMLAAWAAPDDGLLVYDYDGDRQVTHADEISFVDYLAGARTDLEGLNAFDEDGDGKLSANDSVWEQFGVWQDANSNGITDDGEFLDLDDLGISAINLRSDERPYQDGSALVFGTGSYELADGSEAELADVAFLYQNSRAQEDGSDQPDLSAGDDIAQTYLQFISSIAAGSKEEAQAAPAEWAAADGWQVQDDEQAAFA